MTGLIEKAKQRTAAGGDEGRMSSEDRRQQLILTAMSLFSKKGFDGTTTKEIARAAGVTEAIIFRHFPTKNDLYAAILDYKACELRSEEWLEDLREHAARRDDETVFREIISRIIEHHRRDKNFMRLMLYSALEDHALAKKFKDRQANPLHKFLRQYITTRQQEGAFGDFNPNAVIRALFALPIYHSLEKWVFQLRMMDVSEDEAVSNFTRLFLNGLRAPAPPPAKPAPAARRSSAKTANRKKME